VKTTGAINDELKKHGHDKTGPRLRNYCAKWVWAPDRKRALFCGANAGVPHRLNDVWEYDLASNTWICLWEPDPDLNKYGRLYGMKDPEAVKVVEGLADVRDGALMTKRGAPFDPVHTWSALTYDPNTKALLWVMGNQNKIGYKYKDGLPWGKILLWAYYPYENRWEFIRPDEKSPPGQNASILEYIPDRKEVLWYTHSWKGDATSLWNPTARTWKELLGKKEMQTNPACPGTEAIAAYDTKNRVLVAHLGGTLREGKAEPKRTYHYDFTANKWEKVLESAEGPVGFDSGRTMVYDSTAEACLILDEGTLWSYRVNERKWTRLSLKGPAPAAKRFMACYSPEHNVLMADDGNGRVWVYRHTAGDRPRR
jgi:hypothetical protein